MTRALVIGYGSIGARHARVLDSLGCDVAVVSRRAQTGVRAYGDLGGALDAHRPGYVVCAAATVDHAPVLDALAQVFHGRLLMEKPLFRDARPLPAGMGFAGAWMGYNLRKHPIVEAARRLLADETPLAAHLHVGQYLPDWRPGRDYRTSYSAHAAQGGGVLRDLSHELDLMLALFGRPRRVVASGGRLSDLEIDSDDSWSILAAAERCPLVSVQMNYLDRVVRRRLHVTTARHTIEADLVAGQLLVDGAVVETARIERDHTYLAMHRAALWGEGEGLATLAEGAEVMDIIAAVEASQREGRWVDL